MKASAPRRFQSIAKQKDTGAVNFIADMRDNQNCLLFAKIRQARDIRVTLDDVHHKPAIFKLRFAPRIAAIKANTLCRLFLIGKIAIFDQPL